MEARYVELWYIGDDTLVKLETIHSESIKYGRPNLLFG